MNPIHYAKVRPVPCPCCCQCCFMFITILPAVYCERRIQKSSSLFTMQRVLFLVTHRDIVLFFAVDFPPFPSVLLVVPPGQPHHSHISSLLLTCCHFSQPFRHFPRFFASFPYFFLLILITFCHFFVKLAQSSSLLFHQIFSSFKNYFLPISVLDWHQSINQNFDPQGS